MLKVYFNERMKNSLFLLSVKQVKVENQTSQNTKCDTVSVVCLLCIIYTAHHLLKRLLSRAIKLNEKWETKSNTPTNKKKPEIKENFIFEMTSISMTMNFSIFWLLKETR